MKAVSCPKCSGEQVQVIETSASATAIVRRRRECKQCGYRFSTVEITVDDYEALQARVNLADGKKALHALNEIRQVLAKVYGG
jgi:transcriptional regulator NrdR family protein